MDWGVLESSCSSRHKRGCDSGSGIKISVGLGGVSSELCAAHAPEGGRVEAAAHSSEAPAHVHAATPTVCYGPRVPAPVPEGGERWGDAVLCDAVLCDAVLCCVMLCCAMLCCAMLCCAMLCCVMLCCAVRCCAVRCCAV
ncbi:unnamed protein product [Closterium sp. NIES-64]|nr:unnamed protein product [Closterium sp. NIES-64]